ncbi:MAG TPA: DUF2993 domain-containing protein [Streptosporangiaceae bacterium]|nr:DUF2993 domain-containing protein [Streptosporangiaceae bacterium]
MLRELLAVGAAVVVVVAVADRLLAAGAMRRIARRIQLESRANATPTVRIWGMPFLPQLLAGRYSDVEVMLGACTVGGVEFSRLTARLSQVRAPLRQLLAGDGVTAAGLAATAMIPLSVLGRRLPPGLTLRLDGDNLYISGTILRVPVMGTLGIKADPEKISFTPKVTGIPAPVGFVLGLPAMPQDLKITSVQVTSTGLEVTVTGTDVRFGGDRGGPVTGDR